MKLLILVYSMIATITLTYSNELDSTIVFTSSNPDKSKELVEKLNLSINKSINVKSATYHFTEIFLFDETVPSDGRSRYGVFAYVETKGKKYFRFFYKSGSHGIFRVAPFISYYQGENWQGTEITAIDWYSKGIGEGSLALPPKIQLYLAKEISSTTARRDITIKEISNLISSYNTAVKRYDSESYDEYYIRKEKLFATYKENQNKLMAKEVSFDNSILSTPILEMKEYTYKGELRTSLFATPQSVKLIKLQDMPNFQETPVHEERYKIKYYGEVEGYNYLSKNKNVSYYILKNKENKIWIPSLSILGNESKITSYGVPSVALDYDKAYFLMPLWERSKYIHPDYRSIQNIPRKEKYQSAWDYLKNMDIIKSFYFNIDLP